MGWGEARRPDTAKGMADAIRDWHEKRTTGSEQRLLEALYRHEAAQTPCPVSVSLPEPETGRPVGW